MDDVRKLLTRERLRIEDELRIMDDNADRAGPISLLNQLKEADQLLEKCAAHGITRRSTFTRLPDQTCRTPASEYRVMEDMETEDRAHWVEARKEGGSDLRLHEGDVVIECE